MDNLEEIAQKIEMQLNEKDRLREVTLKTCRDIIRMSRKSIRSVHNGEVDQAAELAATAVELTTNLKKSIKDHPDLLTAGYMENASQELAEAYLLLAIEREENLPLPEDIGVTYTSFLLGLGDVVGELRRKAIILLKEGKINEVESVLQYMENITDQLMEFDYPSGLVPVKRKQDVAKKLLEQMRGDFVMFKKNKEFEEKIDIVLKGLRTKSEKETKEDFGLDVDSVWP
jgi:translin